MPAKVTFFPVDNGDMTLVQLSDDNHTSLLIDCKIRKSADDQNDTTVDVAGALRKRLKTDQRNRPYVDAFLLSHPDEDHCLGLGKHFWLGSIDDYPDDSRPLNERRIIIRELWSSPMVFRRASRNLTLCSDAKRFNSEARRRVKANREHSFIVPEGDRILILGEDIDGKTDDLLPIVVKTGDPQRGINRSGENHLEWKLLAPLPVGDTDSEQVLSKNGSSVIINFKIKHSGGSSNFLTGGDAGVEIWERVWRRYSPEDLAYDLLLSPHHCSWRSISHDSWSENGEAARISPDARSALAQNNNGAFIVASSKPIKDDDNDPPCIRAKREYKSILKGKNGLFKCTGEEPTASKPAPLEFEATNSGFKAVVAAHPASSVASTRPMRAGSDD